ncbi:MAG: extensin family protein [Polyangiaceae bacterium]|nr:extensin family protein [Myxococcales bacterium]MCB9584454.1 extensin family protein [Polyangiaceae bacterium]MCB9609297.1 extensin family protein [Polyangiaceae bacterium]
MSLEAPHKPPAWRSSRQSGLLDGAAVCVALGLLSGCAHEAEPAQVPSSAYQGPWSPRPYYYVPGTVPGPSAYPGNAPGNIPAATYQATQSQPAQYPQATPYPQTPIDPPSAQSPVTPGAPLPLPPVPSSAPALAYSGLSAEACGKLLAARQLPVRGYTPNKATRDVALPVQLSGPLNGVSIVMNGAKTPGSRGDYDVLDCRLALSLDDWTRELARRNVRVVRHASLLRPGAVIRKSGRPSQHALGLAIDIASLELADGARFEIQRDFAGAIGAPVCTEQSEPASRWLRSLVCDTHQSRVFNLILTPNYNADHHDHVHLDLEPGKTWFNLH